MHADVPSIVVLNSLLIFNKSEEEKDNYFISQGFALQR